MSHICPIFFAPVSPFATTASVPLVPFIPRNDGLHALFFSNLVRSNTFRPILDFNYLKLYILFFGLFLSQKKPSLLPFWDILILFFPTSPGNAAPATFFRFFSSRFCECYPILTHDFSLYSQLRAYLPCCRQPPFSTLLVLSLLHNKADWSRKHKL